MKIVATLFLVLSVGAFIKAYGIDLDVAEARAKHLNTNPATQDPKALWEKGDPATEQELEYIEEWDNVWWVHEGLSNLAYDYMLFCFVQPGVYFTGTCTWRVVNEDGAANRIYRWSNTSFTWVLLDDGESGEFDCPSWWFGSELGILFLMAVCETPEGDWIKCDVMKIEWPTE